MKGVHYAQIYEVGKTKVSSSSSPLFILNLSSLLIYGDIKQQQQQKNRKKKPNIEREPYPNFILLLSLLYLQHNRT